MIRIRSFDEDKLVIEDSGLSVALLFWLIFGFAIALFVFWLVLYPKTKLPFSPLVTGLLVIVVGSIGTLLGAYFTQTRRITLDRHTDTLIIEDGSWLTVKGTRRFPLRAIKTAQLTSRSETITVEGKDPLSPFSNHPRTAREKMMFALGRTRTINKYGVALKVEGYRELLDLSLDYGVWESAQPVVNAISQMLMLEQYEYSDVRAMTENIARIRKYDEDDFIAPPPPDDDEQAADTSISRMG